ncbi:MAG: 50S ribosomal protein L10 [Chloroflexota bacterium]|nr:50S ribosomal protein L10 [Chloroflexota bacterium]
MPSAKNVDALEELKEKLANNSVLISTVFTGLGVATMTDLRQKLREQGLEYRVVKNTIASLAADEIGSPQIKEVLVGPTGLILGNGDPIAAAKLLTEYLRTYRIIMPLNGAIMDGQVISAEEVNALGLLPTKPVLMSMLMGQLSGVAGRLARALNNPVQSLAIVLERSTESSEVDNDAGADSANETDQPNDTTTETNPGNSPTPNDSYTVRVDQTSQSEFDGDSSVPDPEEDGAANADSQEEPSLGPEVSGSSDKSDSSDSEEMLDTENTDNQDNTDK